ncbi:hypothetical protein ACKWRH_23755 [Bradyrhizobium sp. Pa8]|uniref:hypothetical protein n=1 Tax=Bradyrhizobium sp. Pa8 TaxID=3386552 RepID=UPI00403EF91E
MSPAPPDDIEIVIPPEVQAQLDADPDLKAAFTEHMARIRQAAHQHRGDLDAAMAAMGAERVELEDDSDG